MSSAPVRQRTRPQARPLTDDAPRASGLDLKVVYRPIEALSPSANNARTHSKKQIHKLAASFRQFGFNNPLLVDASGELISGHGRLEAAKQLGIKLIPTICLDHMSEADKRAYRIADNRLAEMAGWDEDLLRVEFCFLAEIDVDFPESTGFETPEIEIIIDGPGAKPPKYDPLDAVPSPNDSPTVSRVGDQWLLGDHIIRCGDARMLPDYAALLGDELAQIVFTDPPYNVAVSGHVGGLGRTKHREFAMASGEMSKPEFTAFLRDVFSCMEQSSADGSLHFTCIDWAHLHEMLDAGHAVYHELKNIVCWAKTNGGMGSLYRSQHELIPVWKKGVAAHINNVQLGAHGRYRTNVWTYAGVNTFRRGRMEELSSHPTVKPCALVMDALKDCSKPGSLVLDPFGGSGTTLIAAHKTRRRARLLELDPAYVDLTVRRWEALSKCEAKHAETGMTFAEVAAERAAAAEEPSCDKEVGHVAG